MATDVLVLGSGYAGTAAIAALQDEATDLNLTWVSEHDYHLVLHEVHRAIRDPAVRDKITIPVDDIRTPMTEFVQGTVTDVDAEEQVVTLDDGTDLDYDYLVVAIGSDTAYYGIPGLEEHAHILKGLQDALDIHEDVMAAAREASRDDPAQVVVGGAGLSGIQSAGELAELRDHHNAPMDIYLVEALEEIFPPGDEEIQRTLRRHLEDAGIEILVDDPITEAAEDVIHFDEREPLEYDVFEWTGGITGRDAMDDVDIENEHNRLTVESTLETSDERVFAVGDAAVVDQNGNPAPPTAVAAWGAGEAVAENVVRKIAGRPLREWRYEDKGTLISVGDTAIAHDVTIAGVDLPVRTFDSVPATVLKKGAAARWIATVTSVGRAADAWGAL